MEVSSGAGPKRLETIFSQAASSVARALRDGE